MNAPITTVYVAPFDAATKFDELDVVRLLQAATSDEGQSVPAGASGTVVAVWADGEAYEVEFERPFHALATVRPQHLERPRQDDRTCHLSIVFGWLRVACTYANVKSAATRQSVGAGDGQP